MTSKPRRSSAAPPTSGGRRWPGVRSGAVLVVARIADDKARTRFSAIAVPMPAVKSHRDRGKTSARRFMGEPLFPSTASVPGHYHATVPNSPKSAVPRVG